MCTSAANGLGCFFGRGLYFYPMTCTNCGVRAPYVMGTSTFNKLCIKCFYNEDANKEYKCDHPGCMQAVAEIEERILDGEVGGGASSVEGGQARNLQLTIQELQNDVAELKATVTQISQQINALSAPPAWQGESSTWAWR